MVLRDREEGGRLLAQRLEHYAGRDDVVVLALPRGGVPVAFEVARALHAPLDIFVVRKLGVPGHDEFALGAIASGGGRVVNAEVVRALRITPASIEAVIAKERKELLRRELAYRDGRAAPEVEGRIVILVDDGLATGSSMQAAIAALRQRGPARIVVAVPVGPVDSCDAMRELADEVVCAWTPEPFHAVGLWYEDFAQTTDEEVREILSRAMAETQAVRRSDAGAGGNVLGA